MIRRACRAVATIAHRFMAEDAILAAYINQRTADADRLRAL